MTGIILDTHTWIWFMCGSTELKPSSRRLIDQHLKDGEAHIAAISCWEVAMLEAKERIKVSMPILEWMNQSFERTSLTQVELLPNIAYESCHLPGSFHGDPADRLIVATARLQGLTLLTRDKKILEYSTQNYVNALPV